LKNLFIFLNIILFFCVAALFTVLFSYKAQPPEKVLQQTPTEANIAVKDIFKQQQKPATSSVLALIADNDLFSPSRGVVAAPKKAAAKAAAMPKRSQLELIGIWTMGSLKGAIIISPLSRKQANKKKKSYVIGEKIGTTAYQLIDINPEKKSAIVGIGNSQFEIKLERNDKGSLRRRSKGEADSKAMASISKPKIPIKPISAKRTQAKPKKSTPVKPRRGRKSPAELKQIRRDILKKMMLQRNKKQ
jgi:hypothetical protein